MDSLEVVASVNKDSVTIVNFLSQYMDKDLAIMIFGVLGIVVPVIWRYLAEWAANRPTTWYWNPITKKFVLNRTSKWIGRVFGRGVNDCNVQYESNLPKEAKEALRQHLVDKYTPLSDPDPNSNECPSETQNRSNAE